MKNSTLYVILNLEGVASFIGPEGLERVSLPELISLGWRPVSETSFGQAPAVLIRLERENEEKMGFGFSR